MLNRSKQKSMNLIFFQNNKILCNSHENEIENFEDFYAMHVRNGKSNNEFDWINKSKCILKLVFSQIWFKNSVFSMIWSVLTSKTDFQNTSSIKTTIFINNCLQIIYKEIIFNKYQKEKSIKIIVYLFLFFLI